MWNSPLWLGKLPADQFTWSRWRACDIWSELGLCCRRKDIFGHGGILRKYAVGYCDGITLLVRPSADDVGIMFLYRDEFQWTHLTREEFEHVFAS